MSVRAVTCLSELKSFTSQPKLTVVDFFATWCGPCKNISPLVDRLAGEKPHVNFCKVDVDRCPDVMQAYPVRAMPTFKFFKNGQEVDSFEGADINRLTSMVTNNEVIPPPAIPSDEVLDGMKPKELLTLMRQHHINSAGLLEKSELIAEIKKYR